MTVRPQEVLVRTLRTIFLAHLLLVLLPNLQGLGAQQIPTPEEHFGFVIGTDKKLARWDGILEYFTLIADGSDRIQVDTAGPTTLGNPFVSITISSPANLARLDEIREASKRIADGRIDKEEAGRIAATTPATVFINHNIHSTEIGSSQTSIELVHHLATAEDDLTSQILDNVVTVLVPSANPDGQVLVTDWYERNVGTDYERARMPWLYHYYAGHDNNRDFFQANLVETRYWMDLMYHTTYPQIYLDQHQMGNSGPRIFVPPYPDPMNPDIHPLQWQQLRFMGGGMVADLQAAGKQGVVTGSMYRIWGQEGALTGRYHNIVGILTETASARIASPDTVALEALERGAAPGRGLGEYGFQIAFVDPWWGGEWTLGDIVDYQMIAAKSVLEQTSKFSQHYIMGRWQMGSETIAKAELEGPHAYVIPRNQADPIAAAEMVDKLILQGVEVHKSVGAFEAIIADGLWSSPDLSMSEDEEATEDSAEGNDLPGEDEDEDEDEGDTERGEDEDEDAVEDSEPEIEMRSFAPDSWIVYGAQPGRAAVLDLLEPRRRRVQHEWPDGPFMRSYDGAAYTIPMQMGVKISRIDHPFEADTRPATSARVIAPPVPAANDWYGISAEITRAHQAVNRMLEAGLSVFRAVSEDGPLFMVSASDPQSRSLLTEISNEIGITVIADPPTLSMSAQQQAARIGVYQGWAGSMDEGWTRLVLDDFDYTFETLMNDDIREEGLSDRLDVIIIPSEIPLNRLIEGASDEDAPPGFRGGIGEEGVENLKAFVRNGGTLVTFEAADALVIEHFDVPVRNALEDVSRSDLFMPASLLRVELDEDHPLAVGSPDEVAAKWAGGRAYEPTDFGGDAGRVQAVGSWAEDPERLLMSGAIVGAENLAGKGAILDVEYGDGRILMYGFRVQHRAQTHGTYKLLFNALLKNRPRTATQDG